MSISHVEKEWSLGTSSEPLSLLLSSCLLLYAICICCSLFNFMSCIYLPNISEHLGWWSYWFDLWWCRGSSTSKESTCSAGDLGLIPGLGRSPAGGHGHPLQYSCLENPLGQRNLAGYSPCSRKESYMTDRLSTAQV